MGGKSPNEWPSAKGGGGGGGGGIGVVLPFFLRLGIIPIKIAGGICCFKVLCKWRSFI